MPITDLTGTTWVLNNENLSLPYNEIDFQINFTSNNKNYVEFNIHEDGEGWLDYVYYDPLYITDIPYNLYATPQWVSQAYRIIEITGGTDATNTDLITWLQENATQQTASTPTTQIALGRAFIKQVISADTYYLTWDNSGNTLNISVNGNTVSQGYELQDGDIIDIAIPQAMVGGLVILANNNSAPSSLSDTDIYISTTPAGGGGGSIK